MRSLLTELLPPVRAEALRLLFGSPPRAYHLRELARVTGFAIGPWQRELAKLEGLRLVCSERDGNRREFRANREHPLFGEFSALVAKTSGIGPTLASALGAIKGIQVAFVFGSLARGAGRAESDVDLFVIGSVGLRQVVPALKQATETSGREINPLVMSSSSFISRLRQHDPLLESVMSAEKIFVIGNAGELDAIVR